MCITCRRREFQNRLIRLQYIEKELIPYSGRGRSIYICRECSEDRKKIIQMSKRFRQDIEVLTVMLKELTTNE